MSDDSNLHERLLELHFGLLSEDEAEELRSEIREDAVLAGKYAAVQADADLMKEAARLQSPKIVLTRPEPNGRGAGTPNAGAATSVPELTPWSRWAQWGLVAAASLLVIVSFFSWTQRRSHLAGVGADRLRLQVTGPSQLLESADNRYSIATTTVTGRPISTNVHFAVYSMGGARLLGHTEKTNDNGTLQVEIPAELQLPEAVRIEIEAGAESVRQMAESRLPVRREVLSTYVRLDRSCYAPGETVYYRAVTLSRFHLEPEGELPVQFVVRGPDDTDLNESSQQVTAERGVAAGEFVLPEDAPGGLYSLLVSSPSGSFPDVRRDFLVEESCECNLLKDLEFAGVGYGPGVEVNAAFRATRRDGTPASQATVQVAVLVGDEAVYEDSAITDEHGTLAIQFQLPEQLDSPDAVLALTIDDDAVRETLLEPIPMGQGTISVEFFPEGGDLAAVGENRVYFSARDSSGAPVTLTGWIVDENGNYCARVETVHEGRGMFQLSPRVGVRYRLILETPVDTEVDGQLPFVMPAQKVVLTTGKGVFAPQEPIEFNVRASQPGLPLVAMASCRGVHVGEQAFLTKSSVNGAGKAVANAVSVSLPDAVAGVIRLTVFDYSVTPPRPVAERLVYRKPLEQLRVAFEPDREDYRPGDTCQLGVSVTDERGQPVESLLGVSVVDETALGAVESSQTMSSHFWLASEVEHPQDMEDASFLLKDTPEAEVALDLLLGTQGWRRFTERFAESSRRDQSSSEHVEKLFAVGDEVLPPLMLDNLSDLLANPDTSGRSSGSGSSKAGHLLAALIVLSGAGMLVLVTMLSLLKVGNGVRLWTPPTIAVGVSFFLVFLTIRPDPSTARTVAFLSYDPGESVVIEERFDRDGEALKAKKKSKAPGNVGPAIQQEEEVPEAGESVAPPNDSAKAEAVPSDSPQLVKSKDEGLAGGKQSENDRKVGSPSTAGMLAKPMGAGMKETAKDDLTEPESAPMSETAHAEVERDGLREEAHARERRDGADAITGSFFLREYRFRRTRRDLEKRVDFAKTVFWNPMLTTDAKGHAQLKFGLSDSVTRFRAVADAQGAGRIGSAVDTIVSKKPLHLSAKIPPEVTLGDRIDTPVVITDERSSGREVHVVMESADSLDLIGSAKHTVDLDGESRGRHVFSAEAAGLSEGAVVRFHGRAGEDVDAYERLMRIKPAGYPRSTTISGVVKDERELEVVVPEDALPSTVHATLAVFPTFASELEMALRSIQGKGLDGTLATVVCADLLTAELKRSSIVDPICLRLAKKRRVEALLQLGKFRDSAGGYSHVEGGAADPLPTSKAVLVLREDQAVFDGNSTLADRAVRWLSGQSGDQTAAMGKIARAWRLWALAESGQSNLASELEAIAGEALATKNAQEIAVAALAASRLSHDLGGRLLDELAKLQAEDGHVAGMGVTNTEMTALAAMAWMDHARDSKPAAAAIQWLLASRDSLGGFGADRETALALRALDMSESSGPRVEGDARIAVYLDGEVLAERDVSADLGQAIVLEDLSPRFKSGPQSLRLVVTDAPELPYVWTLNSFCSERPSVPEDYPLRLQVDLDQSKAEEGERVCLTVRLENTGEQKLGPATAEIGLPAGMEVAPAALEERKKAGRIAAYDIQPRQLALFWNTLEPGETVELTFNTTASVPGRFSGPPSSAYLSRNSMVRYWAEPLVMEIRAKE